MSNLPSTREMVVLFVVHVAAIEEATRRGYTGIAELFAVVTWMVVFLLGAKVERYRASLEASLGEVDDDETQP